LLFFGLKKKDCLFGNSIGDKAFPASAVLKKTLSDFFDSDTGPYGCR
jgi:hypothetical protein